MGRIGRGSLHSSLSLPRDATGIDDNECPPAKEGVVSAIEDDFDILAASDAADEDKLAAPEFSDRSPTVRGSHREMLEPWPEARERTQSSWHPSGAGLTSRATPWPAYSGCPCCRRRSG
jgi:hypothetical protein